MKFLSVFIALAVIGCGSSSTADKGSTHDFKTLGKVLNAKKFSVAFDQASPQVSHSLNQVANELHLSTNGNNASRVDLTGNPNYFKVKGDTISAFLPFYGERYSGNSLNSHGAIEFRGIPKKYELTTNKAKKKFHLTIRIADKNHRSEQYKISLEIFENRKTVMHINSSQRSTIEYRGRLKPLDE